MHKPSSLFCDSIKDKRKKVLYYRSLQKFGQEFLKKLKGKKMPNKLLEKVGIRHLLNLRVQKSKLNSSFLFREVLLKLKAQYC
jgi:hypothetical protein